MIRLMVAPEVSQLDPSAGLRLNGIEVPRPGRSHAPRPRVELQVGAELAVAGLFQQDYNNTVAPAAAASAPCR